MKFITTLKSHIEKEQKSKGIMLIYDKYGKLIRESQFAECEKVLSSVLALEPPRWVLIPFFTLSHPYAKEISSFEKIKDIAK